MSNPWYGIVNGAKAPMNPPMQVQPQYQPTMADFWQAMQNPAAYMKQQFPDIPDSMLGNPAQIMQYLQRTRNISDQQVSQAAMQVQGYVK